MKNHLHFTKRGLFAVLLGLAAILPTLATARVLRPARAVYDLQLNKDRDNAGIEKAKGRLVVELIENCAGFIFNQAFISRVTAGQGPDMVGDMQASVWESRDGKRLRFNLLNRMNGKIVEKEQGRAQLNDTGGGNATWRLPKSRKLTLPKGTLFPISHNREVLARALSGSQGFEIPLFDGSNQAGYYFASVFIGPLLKVGTGDGLSPRDLPSWRIRMAYYHYDSTLGVPEFEVGYTLYGDGVVDGLKLDYRDFGLTGRLVELEYLDEPDCE